MRTSSNWNLLMLLIALSGCSQLMGNLRRDLDDSDPYAATPTVGGRWSERNMLGSDESAPIGMYDDPYSAVGHAERGPASTYGLKQSPRRGWLDDPAPAENRVVVNEEGEEQTPSYANTPTMPPGTRRLYKNGVRATRSDFVDDSANEGSLWASDGQTNYYFTKNKIRGVGDIVSVTVENDLYRDTVLEITRSLTPRERDTEMELAQERIRARALGLPEPDAPKQDQVASSNAAPNRQPAAATPPASAPAAAAEKDKDGKSGVRSATASDIDVGRSLSFKNGEQIMTEIVERYPNGNYKIRGTRRIPYRTGYRMLSMVGIVKGSDISDDDSVVSGKLYEYRLEVIR